MRGRACVNLSNFNPRPPWGGRRRLPASDLRQGKISIHALRGEGDSDIQTTRRQSHISIHALRGEGDVAFENDTPVIVAFQSTPSVGRATIDLMRKTEVKDEFQSTPSVGRATKINSTCIAEIIISIHALRGEGDSIIIITTNAKFKISIHALRGEGDDFDVAGTHVHLYFNPRPPWGGRLYK